MQKKGVYIGVGILAGLGILLFHLLSGKSGGIREQITNSVGMEFVYIPPGTFTMGSPANEPYRVQNESRQEVTLTQGFYMQITEVTQGQWKAVMGNNPARCVWCGEDNPVERVSYFDCVAFVESLNTLEGTDLYALPTEAQWEYACRAGTSTAYSVGDCLGFEQANFDGRSEYDGCPPARKRGFPMNVKSFPPNAFGLYEMHGNVSEWIADWYGERPTGPLSDPTGPATGRSRMQKGGGYMSGRRFCRSAYRSYTFPDRKSATTGLRLIRKLSPGE